MRTITHFWQHEKHGIIPNEPHHANLIVSCSQKSVIFSFRTSPNMMFPLYSLPTYLSNPFFKKTPCGITHRGVPSPKRMLPVASFQKPRQKARSTEEPVNNHRKPDTQYTKLEALCQKIAEHNTECPHGKH